MFKKYDLNSSRKTWFVLTLLIFLILAAYSNTFLSSWHFDDEANIIKNSRLHIKYLTPASLYKTLFAHPGPGSKLHRSIAYMTFALNWYFGGDDVTGYHMVNIAIHFFTAFILFITVINLFNTPNLKDKYKPGSERFIAFLTAALWAVNPIQTQAVTYIVQRMTLMAAMFYVLGIFFYVRARITGVSSTRAILFTACFFSFIFAIGSKENAATFPAALILVEAIFFQDLSLPKTKRMLMVVAIVSGLLVFIMASVLFMKGDLLFFLKGYAYRPFSFAERLMTEPRILVYYLTQIFYPVPDRLSIQHDLIVSESLFKPWTTIPSMMIVFMLIYIGFSRIRKMPVAAFGIIFFFLNHLIESTIIPLELIFEHRNYLPSLFLFWPVAACINRLLDYYRTNRLSIYRIIFAFVIILLVGFSICTYIRNMAWKTEKSLWEDALKKAPESSRPYQRLGVFYSRAGQLDKAIELFQKSLSKRQQKPKQAQVLYYNNMGNIYRKKHEYEKAMEYLERALEIEPNKKIARENMILVLIGSKKWDEALKHLDILIKKQYINHVYLNLKGFILIRQQKAAEAIPYFRGALKWAPHDRDALLYMGIAFSLSGQYERAEWFLRRVRVIYPNDALILFWLAENRLRAGKNDAADEYLDILLTAFGGKRMQEYLQKQSKDNLSIPLSYELLIPAIRDRIEKRADAIAG